MAATVGLSKVFILDKYFTELQKFWETERKLQDAPDNEYLQKQLRHLSSELNGLRSRLSVAASGISQSASQLAGFNNKTREKNLLNGSSGPQIDKNHNGYMNTINMISSQLSSKTTDNKLSMSGKTSGGNPPKPLARGNQPAAVKSEDPLLSSKRDNNDWDWKKSSSRDCELANVDDLIHIPGPLTEDAVLRTLHSRYKSNFHCTNIGPVLVTLNGYSCAGNPLTLASTAHEAVKYPQLGRVVLEAIRQQSESGYPQTIILSGENGAGKTFASMILLRQLFELAGGGTETDAFKHLNAAFTVLRSLGSAKTTQNTESTRIGHFIEVQVTDNALYRTKIHSYFLDQTRVVKPPANEKNFHIFYQILAGLSREERKKLHLEGYSASDLKYLSCGDTEQNIKYDKCRFDAWRSSLAVLGIPFMDVMKILSAILLMGNIKTGSDSIKLDVEDLSESEKKLVSAVSDLLGISQAHFWKGLTGRTQNVRGQIIKSVGDSSTVTGTRDALAKALYCRTVATIVRRANSLKRILTSTCGTTSSDSNESCHGQQNFHHTNHRNLAAIETASSLRASTVGSSHSKAQHRSLNVLNHAVRHATDGFIGILDMFGFENLKPSSHLEHLCVNLCAETMQHFYNTHIFKSCVETCREEGVKSEIEVDYVDNVPCIDFISSLRTGLLSILDVETSMKGTAQGYVTRVDEHHADNSRHFAPSQKQLPLNCDPSVFFGIRHYAGNVIYDTGSFVEVNRDTIPDDIVSVFHKSTCSFGFASHLFNQETKALYTHDTVPCGMSFRISASGSSGVAVSSASELLQNHGPDPVSTLTQDFHTRLDNLLRTLVHARPHFVRCIRANEREQANFFNRATVIRQVRALQVLETVNLMAGGLPHRMRFRAFNARYRCLAPFKRLKRTDDRSVEDSRLILDYFATSSQEVLAAAAAASTPTNGNSSDYLTILKTSLAATSWAMGKRHIFLSESSRQQLEFLRTVKRTAAAIIIQATWRGWNFRIKKWTAIRKSLIVQRAQRVASLPQHPSLHYPTQMFLYPLQKNTLNSTTLKAHQSLSGGAGDSEHPSQLANNPNVFPHPLTNGTHHPYNQYNHQNGMNMQSFLNQTFNHANQSMNSPAVNKARPQPIAGSPTPPELIDLKVLQQMCALFGLDMENPPKVPSSRSYTIFGSTRLGFPQLRIMKTDYPEGPISVNEGPRLFRGQTVLILGPSNMRGHLVVQCGNAIDQSHLHVPYQYLELSRPPPTTGMMNMMMGSCSMQSYNHPLQSGLLMPPPIAPHSEMLHSHPMHEPVGYGMVAMQPHSVGGHGTYLPQPPIHAEDPQALYSSRAQMEHAIPANVEI